MQRRYELLLLDADETLFDFRKAESLALARSMAAWGLEPREGLLERYDLINKGLWEALERGETSQEELKTERFRRLFEALGLDLDAAAFGRLFVERLSEGNFLLPGAEETVRYLASHYTLAILTNGLREVQVARVGSSSIAPFIRHLIVSEEAGASKPDPRIFEYAFAKAGFRDKARALMVGDSLGSDIRGGAAFGIDTCWLNPSGAPNPSGIRPSYEIGELAELRAIL